MTAASTIADIKDPVNVQKRREEVSFFVEGGDMDEREEIQILGTQKGQSRAYAVDSE
jgi:hypothetical protein